MPVSLSSASNCNGISSKKAFELKVKWSILCDNETEQFEMRSTMKIKWFLN